MALFSEKVEEMIKAGWCPVLCIDEFEGFVKRSNEFDNDFLIIITATNGQPFLTQAVAYELVQYLNEEKRKEATIADVEIAIDRSFESNHLQRVFAELYKDLWLAARERCFE